jgi:hypothetical protein
MKEDEAHFYKEQEEFKEKHRQSWEVDIEEKHRLQKMLADKETFESAIRERRAAEFAALQVDCAYLGCPQFWVMCVGSFCCVPCPTHAARCMDQRQGLS